MAKSLVISLLMFGLAYEASGFARGAFIALGVVMLIAFVVELVAHGDA